MKERANRLYELRKSHNLTQVAVALKLNLSLSRISAYENGENIPCDVLMYLADFYGVSIDYILCRTDESNWNKLHSSHFRTEAVGFVSEALSGRQSIG